jgi:hypothetical protein
MMSQMARYLFLVVDVFELHVFGCEHEVLGNEAVQLGKGDPLGNAEPPDVLIELYLERNVVRHGCWLVVAMRCLMGLLVVDVLQKMRCAVVVGLEIYLFCFCEPFLVWNSLKPSATLSEAVQPREFPQNCTSQ